MVFDPSTELEVEVVAHSSGIIWNKANGVDRLVKSLGDSLKTPGKILICGDTISDVPMVRQAVKENPEVKFSQLYISFPKEQSVGVALPSFLKNMHFL